LATEEGKVIKLNLDTAWVKTVKTGNCEACSAKNSCNAMEDGEEMVVEAINRAGAHVDDRVIISIKTSSLLKLSFLLYVFPILCMIAGAFIGQEVAPLFNLNSSVFSAIFAFAFFFIAFLFIKTRGKKLAEKDEYRPKIIKVLRKEKKDDSYRKSDQILRRPLRG